MTGPELTKIRKATGLSQAAFAKRLGYSRQATVSDWENGRKPVPEVVAILARHLELAYK